jgi:hypothetical protein
VVILWTSCGSHWEFNGNTLWIENKIENFSLPPPPHSPKSQKKKYGFYWVHVKHFHWLCMKSMAINMYVYHHLKATRIGLWPNTCKCISYEPIDHKDNKRIMIFVVQLITIFLICWKVQNFISFGQSSNFK